MIRSCRVFRTLFVWSLVLTTVAFGKTNKKISNEAHPSGFAVSQRVLELPIEQSIRVEEQIHEPVPSPLRSRAATAPPQPAEPVQQGQTQSQLAATPGISFAGIPSPGYVPSDSNLSVGPNHIVETVNVQFAVYSKSGTRLAGPMNILTLFSPLGGVCVSTVGDPVTLYDRQADRWVVSMIGSNGSEYGECIAVSQTNDPTGAYYLYGYAAFGSSLNDYPKLSTWATASNSAYLATFNIFSNSGFQGADICGFDRTKMQAGDPSAALLCQLTPSNEGSYLPGDMDGPTPPVDGTSGLFITWQNANPGQLYLRTLTMNFAAGTSTLSSPTTISVANDALACNGSGGQCVPQQGTTQTLDTLGDRMMYRFAIRHFPDHDRAVFNHAVTSGSGVAIRWYELYDPAGAVTLNQQGVYAPDATYRWMASLAEDKLGDIGMGYSASSSSIYPAIRVTGRVPSDPLGTMESEYNVVTGTGAQVGSYAYRWGDYTAMQVDPTDDCTFWYVDQYQSVTGTFDWNTNISSFAFNSCSGQPNYTLGASPASVSVNQGGAATTSISVSPANGFNGSVTLTASGAPANVTAAFNPNPTSTSSTLTFTAGASAVPGTYPVNVTGISGSLTNSTTVSLTVVAAGGLVKLTPAALSFAKVVVGQSGVAKTVTATNTGAAGVTFTSVAVGTANFTITSSTCTGLLAPKKKCTVTVEFTPTQGGALTDTLTFTDTASNNPQTVALSGTGEALLLNPSFINFNTVAVGNISAPQNITITNESSSTVSLTGVALTGSAKVDFLISGNTCGATLGNGASCVVSVEFKPLVKSVVTATLQVKSNGGGSPQAVSLEGTGQ
jgi:Abnormal spindle-like microcephaly-assoc'd, ASPM-SPD-2-Hydin